MSNYYRNNTNNILPAEKIIAILSYFTFGLVGFVWVIIGAITRQNLKPFLKYHIYQSIFLAILFFIVSHLLIFIINILIIIPVINVIAGALAYFFSVSVIDIGNIHLSIVRLLVLIVTIYLSLGALKGKYSYIPWVSDIIKYNIGR